MKPAPALPRCLYLAHRFPFPPDRGDKCRSLAWLKALSARFSVDLATFIDDENDRPHRAALDRWVSARHIADIAARPLMRDALCALAAGRPVTLARFFDATQAKWIRARGHNPYDLVFLFSSAAARMLDALPFPPARLVLDLVDVDSRKWQDFARRGPVPMRLIHEREARLMARAEKRLAGRAARVFLASRAERDLFLAGAPPEARARIFALGNGADVAWWAKGRAMRPPWAALAGGARTGDTGAPAAKAPVILFTGRMDYPPNEEGARWFARAVFPAIRAKYPAACFVIAGAAPTRAVRALARREMVCVTGRVKDMRPLLAHATLAVAPLGMARGVQNKILEAMAAGTAVLATPEAARGIEAEPGRHLMVSKGAEAFAAAALGLLDAPEKRAALAQAALAHVSRHHDWRKRVAALDSHLAAIGLPDAGRSSAQ